MNKSTSTLALLALSICAASQVDATVLSLDATGNAVLANMKARKNGFTPMDTQKSGSGVRLAYRIVGTPMLGSPLTILIQVSSATEAQLFLRAPAGLTLLAPNQALQSPAGLEVEHSVTVLPDAQGRHYLSVFSVANGRPSAAAIPVQVGRGPVQLKPGGNVKHTPSGERIIIVPIQ